MSLRTYSKIYYGFDVTAENLYLDFQESAGLLFATLSIRSYSMTDFASEVARALNAAGLLVYTVTVNRSTRVMTVSATGTFKLLVTSGAHGGSSVFGTMGFTGADKTGTTTYTGGAATGSVYSYQFISQSHVDSDDDESAAYGTVNKSASGKVEVVSFGTENFIESAITYATDINVGTGSPVKYNPQGHSDLIALMRYLRTKGPFEFMPDEDTPNEFQTCLLESSPEDVNGLKYRLKEMYGKNLPGFFETGTLRFRVIS